MKSSPPDKPDPLTADTFIAFMERVWAMPAKADPNGGITVWMPEPALYDRYHDARRTATQFGARMGRLQWDKGENWITTDMPEGGRVYINLDGSAVRKVRWRASHETGSRGESQSPGKAGS